MNKHNKIVDIVCVALVGVIFGGTALWNIVQPNRPTISESEKRTLASMPSFSFSSLADGSYFAGISAFISDTFIGREQLVGLSKKLDTLTGVDYSIGGEENFVLLNPTSEKPREEENTDAISAAFEALLNGGTQDAQTDPGQPEDPLTDNAPEPETNAPEAEAAPETEAPETDAPTEPEHQEPETPAEPSDEKQPDEREPDGSGIDAQPEDPEQPEEPGEQEQPDTLDAGEETEPEETEAPGPAVTALLLSRDKMTLTVGSGSVLYATINAEVGGEDVTVRWTNSDKEVVAISLNPNGGIDVRGLAPGKATLACSYGKDFRETCEVTVTEIEVDVPDYDENMIADFLADGLFIYNDGVYTQAYYSETNSKYYAQTAAYYKQLFGCNVHVVVAPVSSMVIENPNVKSKIADQKEMLGKMEALFTSGVNFVNCYDKLHEHRKDYLFFRTDHHWTQRGAYYAYEAWAESAGLEPTPLEDFDFEIHQEEYQGSMYDWTLDARVKEFHDSVEVFYPTKANTMTVTDKNGKTWKYNSCINSNRGYLCFISGDHPYTVINVLENPQDKNALVLKDSFGNAFVPYLCEHFGNIIVVDTRHTRMNVYQQLKDYGITDIFFVNNIQAANTYAWSKRYMEAVGQYMP
ncbi:MAG: hypothetical protein II889_00445 [Clostridia bacterium]|nr:hypothetical protein [Clostridia bacterium]